MGFKARGISRQARVNTSRISPPGIAATRSCSLPSGPTKLVNERPLIELQAVDVALAGTTVLRGVTWALQRGEHWMIRGANGSGKSTFLRLLRGEVWPAPKHGERIYRLDGSTQMTAIEVRHHIALVAPESQERYLQQEWRMTARDVIHTGFAQSDMLYVKLTREQKRRTESLARQLGITPLLARDMQTLSTGELRKVLIARAVVGHPQLLLLDEVCDGLDAKFRRGLLQMIEKIARHGTQIVYTTHRQDEALSVISHVAEFKAGQMIRQGVYKLPSSGRVSRSARVEPRLDTKPKSFSPLTPAHTAHNARPTAKRLRNAASPLIRIENADVFLDREKVLHVRRARESV
jgi:molybdate transport system ATP-binding protein